MSTEAAPKVSTAQMLQEANKLQLDATAALRLSQSLASDINQMAKEREELEAQQKSMEEQRKTHIDEYQAKLSQASALLMKIGTEPPSLDDILPEFNAQPVQKRRGRPAGTKNTVKPAANATTGKRRGRPPGIKNGQGGKNAVKPANATTGKRRGRPPGVKNATAKTTTAPASKVKAEGGTTLREAMWSVLGKSRTNIQSFLPEYPSDGKGLKITEIKQIIEAEGLWKSSSDNISPMIQNQLVKFSTDGQVVRNEDKRYVLAAGAKLDA